MIFKAGADVVRTITSISHYQSVKMIFKGNNVHFSAQETPGKKFPDRKFSALPAEIISIPSPKYNLHLQQEF